LVLRTNATGIFELLTRGVYAPGGSAIETYSHEVNVSHSLSSVFVLIQTLFTHFSPVVGLVGLIGFFAVWRNKRPLKRFFVYGLVFAGILLAAYLKFPLRGVENEVVYFHGTYLRLRMFTVFEYVFALLIPFGLGSIYTWLPSSNRGRKVGLLLLCFTLPLYLLVTNYRVVNKHNLSADYDFSVEILTALPDRSLLLVDSDLIFGLLYAQTVKQVRQDVLIIPTAMHMRWGYLKTILPKKYFRLLVIIA
jgi:hypothetical protein